MEAMVKQFKKSLDLYKQTGLTYAELQSAFKRIAAVINSRPVSARYGPRQEQSDPDYLEVITPNMLLTGRSGVDLPSREYSDDDSPGLRLAYREELERSWWARWKVQCFDSLLPTKALTTARRNVAVGDVVLISYQDKSKSVNFKLGIVETVEVDQDGLVRTCQVRYRLVRSDLPAEEMRIYFRGLQYRKLRALVQRLCVVLPVEEQEQPAFLSKFGFRDDSVVETDETLEEVSGSQNLLVKVDDVDEKIGIEEPRDLGEDDVEDVLMVVFLLLV